MRKRVRLGVLAALYTAFMVGYVVPSPDATAHSCMRITTNGTTVGTCEVHDEDTHVCTPFGDGTWGVICVGP